MKKQYEAPKAEKMEFDYSETVVASSCINKHVVSYEGGTGVPCEKVITDPSQTYEL